jgi:hypothetical protein
MSVYITGEKNITFLHIPKTAGTSLLDWLINNKANSNHIKWDIHPKLSTIIDTRISNFTFTVIRNPWDRMISMYYYFKNIAISEGSRFLALNNITADNFPTFDRWLMEMDSYIFPEEFWFKITTPQVEWIDKDIDLVVRYENLETDFSKLQEAFTCYLPLPKLYVSGHLPYRDYYNGTTKKIVEKISELDIDRWQYQF